jgi:hypothetical protein
LFLRVGLNSEISEVLVKRAKKANAKSRVAQGAIGVGVAALAAAPGADAAVFNVTNLSDSGAGSLRQAIVDANGAAGADVVTFDAALTGTITLTTGQLYIVDSLDVQGPGPAVITVSGNNASRVFYAYSPTTTIDVRIAGLTITEGATAVGAGVVNFGQVLALDDVVITENNATLVGAGIFSTGINSSLTITNSTISGNVSDDDGGGIFIYQAGGTTTIEDSVITGNEAANDGGGIYFYAPADAVTIRDTEVSGNTANFGAGIFFYDTDATADVLIDRSTISGNTAIAGGGIFFYAPDNPITIENSTISGNVTTLGPGAGIFFYTLYSGFSVNFTTIVNNTAGDIGGGMAVDFGTPVIDNSIIADNTGTDESDLADGSAASFDLRYTLLEVDSGNVNDIVGNIFGVDPQLGPLANNGGPTQTHRPDLASPVVGVADPGLGPPPLTDQRGEPRFYPAPGSVDMGAVELIGGVIQFTPTTYTVSEDGGSVTLTVTRNIGPDEATVDYTTTPGTATPGAGNDYTTTTGTLTFAPGDLSETFSVPILDDATPEPDEQFTATLSNPSLDASLGAGSVATVTITDLVAGEFVFSSATYSVNETGGSVLITVNRVNGDDGAASVNYTTVAGTATPGPGNDYTTTSGTLIWADGDTTPQSFSVPILDDTAVEGDETFTVSLNTPSGGTVGVPGDATVTIVDDPVGTAQFSASVINTTEEAGTVTVTVTRTGGTEGPLSVNYTTAPGTATTPDDYATAAGVVTFPAGDATSQTFNITLVNDNVSEGAEMFTASLSGAAVGTPSTVTINLAASDAAASVPYVPTLSWWGRFILTVLSALAGLYVMVRNRFSAFLVGLLMIGLFAAPQLSAQQNTRKALKPKTDAVSNLRKADNGGKFRGTLQSVETTASSLVLNLSGGVTLTIPKAAAKFVDNRSAKPRAGSAELLTSGRQVVVKLRTDAKGNIVNAKIKIMG